MKNLQIEGIFRNGTGEVHLRLTSNKIIRYDYNGSFNFTCSIQEGDWIVTLIGFANADFEFTIKDLDLNTEISNKTINGPSHITENFLITV